MDEQLRDILQRIVVASDPVDELQEYLRHYDLGGVGMIKSMDLTSD